MTGTPLDLQPTLAGELLTLRPLRPSDYDALFAAASDPLIWEQHPDRTRWTPEGFRAFFEGAVESRGALVALDRADGQVIGSSRYYRYDAARSEVEVGWSFLVRSRWGGRYNGEMKRLMLDHAFGSVARVIFVIGPGNRRSQRAVEKLGGTRTDDRPPGIEPDKVVYEITVRRWRGGSS